MATPIEGVSVAVAAEPGAQAFSFYGPWDHPGQSIDQRIKMAAWIELFAQRGGQVIYHSVTTSDLPGLVPLYDLTIIAAGKGEIVELFDRDATRSKYTSLLAKYFPWEGELYADAEPTDARVPRRRLHRHRQAPVRRGRAGQRLPLGRHVPRVDPRAR